MAFSLFWHIFYLQMAVCSLQEAIMCSQVESYDYGWAGDSEDIHLKVGGYFRHLLCQMAIKLQWLQTQRTSSTSLSLFIGVEL